MQCQRFLSTSVHNWITIYFHRKKSFLGYWYYLFSRVKSQWFIFFLDTPTIAFITPYAHLTDLLFALVNYFDLFYLLRLSISLLLSGGYYNDGLLIWVTPHDGKALIKFPRITVLHLLNTEMTHFSSAVWYIIVLPRGFIYAWLMPSESFKKFSSLPHWQLFHYYWLIDNYIINGQYSRMSQYLSTSASQLAAVYRRLWSKLPKGL